jgi:hypothetical protein
MKTSARALLGLAVATSLTATACSDTARPFATAPDRADAASQSLLGGLLGGVTSTLVAPINRTTPLSSDVVWTFTAGPGGVTSSNPSVGLTIVVPPGALESTVTFTVTALAGAPVAYRFEPHAEFERKVSLTQDLSGTTASLTLLPLVGAHFETDLLELNSDGLATVTEVVPSLVNLLSNTTRFKVSHFSGWIVASGDLAGDGQ